MTPPLPDWQLPPGVNRGLWNYVHDPAIARAYDESLAGVSLLRVDQAFAERYFDKPGRLLDMGCGTGRLLIPFAQRGYWALGVDLSEEMLAKVAEKARLAQVRVHRVKANLVELESIADQSFDYAASLFSTLGMIVGTEQRRRVVAHAFRVLRPGGRFVLHVHNRWFNLWNSQGRAWLLRNAWRSVLGEEEKGDRSLPPHQGSAGLLLHLFTQREATETLRRAGFHILELRPVSLAPTGLLPFPRFLPRLRAYGYLLAAKRPP
jgi:SAM-dependent methyltransferase